MLPRFTVLSLAYFLQATHFSTCFAAVSNRTIDDTYGDAVTGFIPIYTSAKWNVGQDCSGCFVRPDPHQAFDSSWHDITYNVGDEPPSVALKFTGTAIYLFSIVPNTVPRALTNVSLQFILDGVPVGTYAHTTDDSSTFEYSVPVLSLGNLFNGPHTLVAEPNAPSLFLLDRAVYTFEDASDTKSAAVTVPARSSSFAGTDTHSTQMSQTLGPAIASNSPQPGVSTSGIVGTSSATVPAQSSSSAGTGTNTESTQTSQTPVPASAITSDSPQRHSGVSTPRIVGSAAGAAGAILVLFTAVILCVRRRRRLALPDKLEVEAYQVPYGAVPVDVFPPSYMPADPYPKIQRSSSPGPTETPPPSSSGQLT